MKRLSRILILRFISAQLAAAYAGTKSRYSGSRPFYGGGHHTTSHNGHYYGATNSHHRNGHYGNWSTRNHYGVHKPR